LADSLASAPPRIVWLIPGLGLLSCLGPFANDLFVPSLSLVAAGLGTGPGAAQLTMTSLLIGFSLGSLLYGPLSDRFGRKPMLLFGLAVYVLSAWLAAVSAGLGYLVAARTLQGLGASSTMVLTRAIVLDRWTGAQASRMLSWIAIFMFLAPVLAPLAGGYIASFGLWQTVFWVQCAVGALALLLTAACLPRAQARRGTNVTAGLKAYALILADAHAVGYMMCTGLGFVGVITFVSNSSVVFVDYYGLSPRMQGVCFSIVMSGAAIGSFVNGRLVTALGISRMIGFGSMCLAIGGCLVFLACVTEAGVVPLVGAAMLYVFGVGFIFANTVARMMSHFRGHAGAASSVFAVNQFLIGALVTAGLSTISEPSLMPLGTALAFAGLAMAALWWGWLRSSEFSLRASGNAA